MNLNANSDAKSKLVISVGIWGSDVPLYKCTTSIDLTPHAHLSAASKTYSVLRVRFSTFRFCPRHFFSAQISKGVVETNVCASIKLHKYGRRYGNITCVCASRGRVTITPASSHFKLADPSGVARYRVFSSEARQGRTITSGLNAAKSIPRDEKDTYESGLPLIFARKAAEFHSELP